jgi:hypothetical protein
MKNTPKQIIEKKLIDYNYNKCELAILVGISHTAMYDKLAHPDKFVMREIKSLFKILKFTDQEKLDFLR